MERGKPKDPSGADHSLPGYPPFKITDLFRHFQSRFNHPFNDNPDEN